MSYEDAVRHLLRSRFEASFEERVRRAMAVPPQVIVPHHHFTWASTECIALYRDGYFMATAMVTQSLNEALVRFIAQRNGIDSNQDLRALADLFEERKIMSASVVEATRRILGSFRNDFHHLNPSISNVPVEEIARRNIEDIATVEKEIFEHAYEDGKIHPKQPKYWDITSEGTIHVSLRSG